MKNAILSLAFIATMMGTVYAQEQATVKVNVILNPTLSLTVNDYGQDEAISGLEEADAVNLVYKTADHYTNGVEKEIVGHLKATSIGSGFKIYAEVTGSGDKQNLARTSGTGSATMDGTLVSVNVGGAGAKVIRDLGTNRQDMGYIVGSNSSSTSTMNQLVDVTYKADPLTIAQVKAFLGAGTSARYTTNVMYTITAP